MPWRSEFRASPLRVVHSRFGVASIAWGVAIGAGLVCMPSSALAAITGTVVRSADQSPIEGAQVSIQASDTDVQTDALGEFVILRGYLIHKFVETFHFTLRQRCAVLSIGGSARAVDQGAVA